MSILNGNTRFLKRVTNISNEDLDRVAVQRTREVGISYTTGMIRTLVSINCPTTLAKIQKI
jgi:hypothetical protein